jgi:hypothetical protein
MTPQNRIIKISKRLLLIILISWVGTSCTIIKKDLGQPVSLSQLHLEEKTTDFHYLLEHLGPPNKLSALPDGFAFLYETVAIKENQLGLGIPLPILEWFKFSIAQGKADYQTLLLTFDQAGMMQSHQFRKRQDNLGRGVSLQIFFAVAPLVNTKLVQRPSGAYNWGRLLLQPLPSMLNVRQSLETGEAGLEQRGVSRAVGQHTLELR